MLQKGQSGKGEVEEVRRGRLHKEPQKNVSGNRIRECKTACQGEHIHVEEALAMRGLVSVPRDF